MSGRVFLIGTGPGDPDLLTLKAHRLISAADVAVYDRLVSPAILALLPKGATRLDVGKAPGRHPVPQEEINALLLTLARAGRNVLRLKGGDPMLFGRGGEEAAFLTRHGVTVEVVPGITAAQGAAAQLVMPLTHRGVARSVRYVTGHAKNNDPLALDWHGLADPQTTLVVYMGLATIGQLARKLMAQGAAPDLPVRVVSRATLSDTRQLLTSLAHVARDVQRAGITAPALFIIGEVARLAMGEAAMVSEGRETHGSNHAQVAMAAE